MPLYAARPALAPHLARPGTNDKRWLATPRTGPRDKLDVRRISGAEREDFAREVEKAAETGHHRYVLRKLFTLIATAANKRDEWDWCNT